MSLGQVREPWQLYLADAVLAFGWAGMSLGMITNTLGLWFDKKRGMAISLALNGASFGGIAGVPLLVIAIGHFGFSQAMIIAAGVMVVLVVPVVVMLVGRPPRPVAMIPDNGIEGPEFYGPGVGGSAAGRPAGAPHEPTVQAGPPLPRPRPKVASTESPPAAPVPGARAPQDGAKETKSNETPGAVTPPTNPAATPAEQYDYE